MRHGAEPWEALAVKLMLKWPGLHYMTSAFAPKYYPKAIIDYANTRGSDKVMYAGYYPMGLTLERIFAEMEHVPLRDEVWPKFLRDNAARVFRIALPSPAGSRAARSGRARRPDADRPGTERGLGHPGRDRPGARGRGPTRVHARPRRAAGGRHRERPGLPRRLRLGRGRQSRGQRLLRPERIPDHPPAARGVDPDRDHPARRLLGQAGPTSASRVAGAARRHPPLRLAVRPGRDPGLPARRRPEHALLRRELAPDRDRPELLRPRVGTVPAPPHVDPGDRGAVLPGLAARGARSADPPALHPGPARGDPDRCRPLCPRDGPPLPQRDGCEPALLRDRHPGPGHPGRGSGRHPPPSEHARDRPVGQPPLLGAGHSLPPSDSAPSGG